MTEHCYVISKLKSQHSYVIEVEDVSSNVNMMDKQPPQFTEGS